MYRPLLLIDNPELPPVQPPPAIPECLTRAMPMKGRQRIQYCSMPALTTV